MGQPRLRASAKTGKSKKQDGVFLSGLRWVIGFAGTLYLSWLLVFPHYSGSLGLGAHTALTTAFGWGAYLLPVLLLNALARYVRSGKPGGWITTVIGSLCALLGASAFVAAASGLFAAAPAGGTVGSAIAGTLLAGLGGFGALALSLTVLLFSLQIVFGLQWLELAASFSKLMAQDYQEWQRSRAELATQVQKVKPAALNGSSKPAPGSKTPPDAARHDGPPPVVIPKNVNEPEPKPVKVVEVKPEAARPAKASKDAEAAKPTPAPKDSPYANYKLPSLQLLDAPSAGKDRGKPSESEIHSAIADLERTLKSFDIDAKVTGYAPGPVITRYELSPAPGVKVSSIVALENDIALAMKAKGIRIIAPIPGKAAVGIEIPNNRPAMVVLREILESPALPPDAPLLSFALGLSSSGEALGADLQKMPHVLVAGSTGSGKSVLIHSLILSILFRARPDEVKFLLIDPKRIELFFYDGIPHLFNPTAAAEKVTVVTNPKDASKSLLALVRLMEKRYEMFQLFGVRNIDAYNREADKRGSPREYFIVVVIDELADLMLVAQDSVEDSIQRLTQMARAVGIHLVLATQRPSVDVITGVIKANLPTRIALQVTSKVDSKVILDCSGADSLQGKGDMLYLAPGAQKPERCQGAYVGEDEINKVVAHLRTQGKPDYAMLETMSKGGAEADLASFGVEPLEFSQALKLVIERRRVSQDLLKSQFGSSARATNILSLLEVKEMIHKPEGSNRWEIHFDMIEDYMQKHFPQVPLDVKD